MTRTLLSLFAVAALGLATPAFAQWSIEASLASGGLPPGRPDADAVIRDARNAGTTAYVASRSTVASIYANMRPGANTILFSPRALAAVAAEAPPDYGYNCGWEVWLTPFAAWADGDRDDRHGGFDADLGGANLGVTKNFHYGQLGASFGYAFADVDARGGRTHYDADHWSFALHGGFARAGFFANALAGRTWTNIDHFKFANVAGQQDNAGERDGHAWFASLELGYRFHPGRNITLTPSVGWEYLYSEIDGFRSRFNPAERYGKARGFSSRLPFMVKAEYAWGLVKFHVKAGYIRELRTKAGDVSLRSPVLAAPGQFVTVSNAKPSKDYGTVGFGADAALGRWNVGGGYDYLKGSREDAHRVGLRVGVTF